ncbi:hypothetical protein [Spirosoma agri]|uniref:hypothetical protein n=1 Tax=Spirosoma agri TaxID=1987381 RepID=UPI003742262A
MRILYRVFLIILTTGCLTDRTALAQWSSATLSQARANIAITNVGTKAFFAGGYLLTTYTSSDQVDIYDDSTGQWTTLSSHNHDSVCQLPAWARKPFLPEE